MRVHLRDILRQRLRNQRLVGSPFAKAEDAVAWLVAVQSQDYAGAKWAVGQRTTTATALRTLHGPTGALSSSAGG
jgi:hypothetical protein